MRRYWRSGALVALIVLSSCVKLPPRVALDRSQAGNIRTIGFLSPSIPKEPMVFALSGTGGLALFGIIGAAIDTNIQLERGRKYHAKLDEKQFSIESLLVQGLTATLQAKGYNVTPIPVTRAKEGYVTQFPEVSGSPIDAFLDIYVANYGYFATTISAPFRPNIALRLKLVRASDHAVLAEDAIAVSAYAKDKNAVIIRPDEKYSYKNFDRIMENLDESIEGLRIGANKVVDAASALF